MKENRTIVKQIRLSPEAENLLNQNAELCGYDHADSKFMRSCLLDNTMPLSKVKQLAYRSYSAWQSMHTLVNSIEKARLLNPNGRFVFEPNGRVMTTDSFNRRLKKYCKDNDDILAYQNLGLSQN